ncbi:MAG: Clp protease N-terminal domain-containing protein [Nocardioidaceae bacterium]
MFERFTKRARLAVSVAERHSREATASEIRPEHLLMGLLDDKDCLAVRVVGSLGVPVARLREELDARRLQYVDGLDRDDAEALKAIGIDLDEVVRRIDRNLGGLSPRRRGRPRFSRAAKKALELALREALALRHNYIGTEHLLLGLARSDDRVVADTLAACGLDRTLLRRAVAEAVRQAG